MKDFQFKGCYNKRAMLRKLLLPICLWCGLVQLNAQESVNLKLGIEAGILPLSEDTENLGLFLNVEPKINIFENTFLGVRFGLVINSHVFENSNSFEYLIEESFDNAIFSFVPTIDYYLNDNQYRPYIGGGVGLHLQANPIEVFPITSSFSEAVIDGKVKKRIGFLVRGGFETGKLRIGIEYNFVPKVDIEIPNGEIVGTVENHYVGLSIGVMFGGGKNFE